MNRAQRRREAKAGNPVKPERVIQIKVDDFEDIKEKILNFLKISYFVIIQNSVFWTISIKRDKLPFKKFDK